MPSPRAIFFGTPAIAVPALNALTTIAEVAAVVCQPDRPSGRGLTLTPPPVKERALALGIPVIQPEKVRTPEFAEWARSQQADVALVIAYGRILPKAILQAPRVGCLNLHASLLPKYRGAAPITWSIYHGETETGISLMLMDEGMDTGPVYTKHTLPIGPNTTADDLTVELGKLAADVVLADMLRVVSGELTAQPQDSSLATTARILQKEDGKIDWSRPAPAVHNHIRAMTSWPGAFTHLGGKLFKVLASSPGKSGLSGAPGTVVMADKRGIEVVCGDGTLAVLRGQLEGKKALSATELISGRAVQVGAVFG
ncbi:MAG: methionyl-tRNA formyltransferase [Polyangiaceae bacterium]|nr:methionyl-tRNA formyltransferase [Polyangiaceae bacterium]